MVFVLRVACCVCCVCCVCCGCACVACAGCVAAAAGAAAAAAGPRPSGCVACCLLLLAPRTLGFSSGQLRVRRAQGAGCIKGAGRRRSKGAGLRRAVRPAPLDDVTPSRDLHVSERSPHFQIPFAPSGRLSANGRRWREARAASRPPHRPVEYLGRMSRATPPRRERKTDSGSPRRAAAAATVERPSRATKIKSFGILGAVRSPCTKPCRPLHACEGDAGAQGQVEEGEERRGKVFQVESCCMAGAAERRGGLEPQGRVSKRKDNHNDLPSRTRPNPTANVPAIDPPPLP